MISSFIGQFSWFELRCTGQLVWRHLGFVAPVQLVIAAPFLCDCSIDFTGCFNWIQLASWWSTSTWTFLNLNWTILAGLNWIELTREMDRNKMQWHPNWWWWLRFLECVISFICLRCCYYWYGSISVFFGLRFRSIDLALGISAIDSVYFQRFKSSTRHGHRHLPPRNLFNASAYSMHPMYPMSSLDHSTVAFVWTASVCLFIHLLVLSWIESDELGFESIGSIEARRTSGDGGSC